MVCKNVVYKVINIFLLWKLIEPKGRSGLALIIILTLAHLYVSVIHVDNCAI